MGKVLSPDISLGRYSREKDARFARAESSPTDGSQERSLNYDGHCLAEEKGAGGVQCILVSRFSPRYDCPEISR